MSADKGTKTLRVKQIRSGIGFDETQKATLRALGLRPGVVVRLLMTEALLTGLIGGTLGGKLAGRIKPSTLRWTVVTIGVIVSVVYFVRG